MPIPTTESERRLSIYKHYSEKFESEWSQWPDSNTIKLDLDLCYSIAEKNNMKWKMLLEMFEDVIRDFYENPKVAHLS